MEPNDHPADVTRMQWLREELALLQDEIGQMVDRGSWQAAVAARRLALVYRTEIDDLRKEEDQDQFQPQTIDEIVADLSKLPIGVFSHPAIAALVADAAK